MTIDVLPAHPHLWAVAIQVVCLTAVAAAAVRAWRQAHPGRPRESIAAASQDLLGLLARQVVREHVHRVTGALIEDQHRAAVAELNEELEAWPAPVESLR